MGIPTQVEKIRESLRDYPNVRVIAAVKCLDIMKTKEVVNAGIRDLGENRKEEFIAKYEALKGQGITWHFFGMLQIHPKLTSAFVDSIDYLHSLTSIDLANAINKVRKKNDPLKCFVQVNIASSSNRAGLDSHVATPCSIQEAGLPSSFNKKVLSVQKARTTLLQILVLFLKMHKQGHFDKHWKIPLIADKPASGAANQDLISPLPSPGHPSGCARQGPRILPGRACWRCFSGR